MNVTTIILAVAALAVTVCLASLIPAIGNALLATARALLAPWRRPRRAHRHHVDPHNAADASALITTNPDTTDPYDAALTAWHTEVTGAPTADLASHPTTGKVHNRRGRRTIDAGADIDPHLREHHPDLDAAALGGAGNLNEPATAGLLDTYRLRTTPTAEDFTRAGRAGNHQWFVRIAETTDDPHIAATALAAGAATAWRIGSPDAADLAARAADVSDLVDYEGLGAGLEKYLRITTELPGGRLLTVAGRDAWLPAAAAVAASTDGDPETAIARLRNAPLNDPAVEVLRIVEQARAGHNVALPSTHLTDATNVIAAAAVAALN